MSSEFSDREFVAGSLTGIRSFKVDKLGRLTGVSVEKVWRPGENAAACDRRWARGGLVLPGFPLPIATIGYDPVTFSSVTITTGGGGGGTATPPATPPVSLVKKPKHIVGNLSCNCGFYAYFDNGHNPHHAQGQVLGLIEGYGTVTVGTRGFRASKARLVALVLQSDSRFARMAWQFYAAVLALWLLSAASITTGVFYGTENWSFGVTLAGAICDFIALSVVTASDFLVSPQAAVFLRRRTSTRIDLVRRNYPDVPVYRSVRAALRAHPLTPPPAPPVPTPETDEDFWTRSAS